MSKKKRAKAQRLEHPSPAVGPMAASAPELPKPIPWRMVLAVVEPLLILGLYIYLLGHSWLRWMDPLIDFPRDLYYAWRLSQGDLLYKQLANWYGPLAQLVQAEAFRLFGVGIDTIIWTNIGLTAVVVVLLRNIFRTLGNRLSGWLAAVVFLGVFAFAHYGQTANCNFLAPYVAQATYSFAGLVFVLWGVVHHLKSGRSAWLGVAGLGLAVAYLDKPEALLAALGSLGIYFAVRVLRAARLSPPVVDWPAAARWLGPTVSWLGGGFFSLWLPIFLYFWVRGGLRYAILATDYVPYTVLASRFRHTLMTAHVQQVFLGFDQPWAHFVRQSLAGLALILVCGTMLWSARAWAQTQKFSIRWYVWPVVMLVAGGVGEWLADTQAEQWMNVGAAIAFPVILAAIILACWSLRAAWAGRGDWMRPLGLAVVGVAAALMLARMILNARIFHFGFFMMPLAVLWLVHLLVVEGARFAANGRRTDFLLPVVFSALVLIGAAERTDISLRNYAIINYPVGQGRDHFYALPPNISSNGLMLNALIASFKEHIPNARTLVVFPEGIAVNYHLRVPTTLAELEFQPVALAYAGPAHVLGELAAHPPDNIMLFDRDFTEFGVPYFGFDEASGRNLVQWINDHYWLVEIDGHTDKTASRHEFDILKPRTPGSSGTPLLVEAGNPALPTGSMP